MSTVNMSIADFIRLSNDVSYAIIKVDDMPIAKVVIKETKESLGVELHVLELSELEGVYIDKIKAFRTEETPECKREYIVIDACKIKEHTGGCYKKLNGLLNEAYSKVTDSCKR